VIGPLAIELGLDRVEELTVEDGWLDVVGTPGDYLGMTVDVSVISEKRAEAFSA
jgi:hypothetical protein